MYIDELVEKITKKQQLHKPTPARSVRECVCVSARSTPTPNQPINDDEAAESRGTNSTRNIMYCISDHDPHWTVSE